MKNAINKVLNLLLYLVFCVIAGTGLLLNYRLPPGSRGGHGLSFLDMTRHEWGDIHFWLGWVFIVLLVVHLAMHWRWFVRIAAKAKKWPLIIGFGTGAFIIALFLLPPITDSEENGRDGYGHYEHR